MKWVIHVQKKGRNSMVFPGIWLVIELGQEILPTNNVTKFDDGPLKNIQVTERTRFILAILANSRAITPKCLMGCGLLLNLAERLCQQTISQSLMMIHWLYKIKSSTNQQTSMMSLR